MTAYRLAALLIGLLLPGAAAAQTITGQVKDQSGAPVRGAFVQLFNIENTRVAALLSGVDGRFVFRTPPGTYSLRVDLIGHRTATVQRIALGERDTRSLSIALETSAVRLQALQVTTSKRCRLDANSAHATSTVWKEAARALEVSRWVESGGAGVFRSRVYEQELDGNLQPARRPDMRFLTRPGTKAFFALSPDSLSRFGFIRADADSVLLYGPDAEVLLSDIFLNDHCFWLERDPKLPGLIGLGFEPAPGRRVAEIRGVLWIDEATSALRFIDYGYVNQEHFENKRYAGGRTEFEHLPSGAWIIRKWYIRAPLLTRSARGIVQIAGAIETGGDVLDVAEPNHVATVFVPRFTVEGIVFDSTTSRPLAGAEVYLAGTGFSAVADEQGGFAIGDVPQGDYYIAFAHPRMDSLPEYPAPTPLRVDSAMPELELAIASSETIAEQWCPAEERLRVLQLTFDTASTNRGFVFGQVRTNNGPLEGAVVRLRWKRLEMPTPYLKDALVKPVTLEIDTDRSGRFSFCGAPIAHPLTVEVRVGRERLIDPELRVGWDLLVYRDYLFTRGQ